MQRVANHVGSHCRNICVSKKPKLFVSNEINNYKKHLKFYLNVGFRKVFKTL